MGSAVIEGLVETGQQVVCLDNLKQGHREAVPGDVSFVFGDIRDSHILDQVFLQFRIDAVMHLAGDSIVQYSMTDPHRFFQNNLAGGLNLLAAMLRHNVRKLVFSSTAAVYGEPTTIPINERHQRVPVNSYGESKLMFEKIMEWYGKAYGLRFIGFRYFNAAGASERCGEDHRPETHLIPRLLRVALGKDPGPFTIYAADYPTRDGSCVRDYIHVADVARAHILALRKLENVSGRFFNLGLGKGFSNFEVLKVARQVTGVEIPLEIGTRRHGDPAMLVADPARAQSELGWKPAFTSLESIIGSAWEWMKKHPDGYTTTDRELAGIDQIMSFSE